MTLTVSFNDPDEACRWRSQVKDEVGNRYGKLTVKALAWIKNAAYWRCQCDCGKNTTVFGGSLRRGRSKSCGCGRATNTVRHGHYIKGTQSPTYHSWRSMLTRCNDANHCGFEYWGGRGITVCSQWLTFENFLTDMGERPDGTSIDRINNDGNYEPGNCRWATPKEQRANRRAK